MPRKNGFALLAELKARIMVDFPSVVLTSSHAEMDVFRAGKNGASDGKQRRRSGPTHGRTGGRASAQQAGKEPDAGFGLIGPVIGKAFGGIVACRPGGGFHLADRLDQALVILAQFRDHRGCIQIGARLIGNARGGGNRPAPGQRGPCIPAAAPGHDIGPAQPRPGPFVAQQVQTA
ncbi:hypothetical protein E4T56_gene17114, partial [Termitomyces sp. T112]